MNIAICDDNIFLASKIESLVDKAFSGNSLDYECDVFHSGDSLLKYLDLNPLAFQLYLLDIEMDGTNGLDTAALIRQQDPDAVIIFMTVHVELMSEAFKVLAFQYIVKPFDDQKTIAILLSAIQYLQDKKSLFQYVVQKKKHTLYLSQIEYIESRGRKVVLHTTNQQVLEYYDTLKEVLKKIQHINFTKLHNSFIINMAYLSKVESQQVVMKSGIKINIGNKYHDSFHNAYRKFVLSKTGF